MVFDKFEEDVWAEKSSSITEGQIVQSSGRPIALRYLVGRFWGWPKSAAVLAASVLRREADGAPVELHLAGTEAESQQAAVIRSNQEIIPALLRGLRIGASTESRVNAEIVDSIHIAFVRPGDSGGVTDDGLTRGLLKTIANRFNVSVDALRQKTVFGQETTEILISVDVTDLEDCP